MGRLLVGVLALGLLFAGAVRAHPTLEPTFGRPKPVAATPEQIPTFTALLGQPPAQALILDDTFAVAIVATRQGQRMAAVDLYLKSARWMPATLDPALRITNIRLRGDLISFQGDDGAAAYDYLWDSEEPGPPYWKRTPIGTGDVTYAPHVDNSLVAHFYLRDPLGPVKQSLAELLRQALGLPYVAYIDGAVLILATDKPAVNAALRWEDDEWVEAGWVTGVVNHHAVADLNGDGMVELLAGDNEIEGVCTRGWNALYSWDASKTQMVVTPVRANSASSLAPGPCTQPLPACSQQESLTFDRFAQPRPVLHLRGTRDTSGCPSHAADAHPERYERQYAWNPEHAAFEQILGR